MTVVDQRAPRGVELNGINVIAEAERKGTPRDLFWPWFAANISVLGISYGSFVLGFGVSFWQASIAGGRRHRRLVRAVRAWSRWPASAARRRRWCSRRAAFGVRGNRLPAALSWLLTVGWETVLVVAGHAGDRDRLRPARLGRRRRARRSSRFVVVAAIIVAAGVARLRRRSCGCRRSSPSSPAS